MTLTIEELRAIAEEELDACSTLDAAKLMARELLANREAQPVGWLYDGDRALPPMFVLGGDDPSEYWKVRYVQVYTAPPAPAVPGGLKRAVTFYEQVKRENPPVETGAWKDAVNWVLEEARRAAMLGGEK